MNESQSHLVHIEKPVYGGSFLARVEGKAIFVPLTLPGEEARIRVVEDKRSFSNAEPEQILTESPDRVAPGCRHFGTCGGCNYQHANYAAQLGIKEAILRETLERGGVHPPDQIDVLSADPWAYRNRIRLAVDAHGNIGYRGRRSHAVIPVAECPIAAPSLVAAAQVFAEFARTTSPRISFTELTLFCNTDESSLLATLFLSSPTKLRLDDFAAAVRQRVPSLAGMEFVVEDRKSHQSRVIGQWGATSLQYRAAGFDYRVDHGAFFQVNRWLVDALVERVTTTRSGKLAWDLFAGVGLFARRLTQTFERVIAVESAPAAIDALTANLNGTGGTAVRQSTLEFLRKVKVPQQPDLIVADPPRTGLGADIVSSLTKTNASTIVYVSCDPATLTRDLRDLLAGGYSIHSIALADLFPQTFHLETVVELRRA